jgi:hypothetical protein
MQEKIKKVTTKKKFKFIYILAIQILVSIAWFIFDKYTTIYIYQNPLIHSSQPKRFLVPREIILKRDCKAFKEFANLKSHGYILPVGCPWEDLGPVGDFKIRDVRLKIPREYLWLDKYEPNGECNKNLYLAFEYPAMNPRSFSKSDLKASKIDLSKEIMLSIGSVPTGLFEFKENFFITWALYNYFSASKIDLLLTELARRKTKPVIIYMPVLGVKGLANHNGHIYTYYEGDLLKPTYWLVCGIEAKDYNPSCESSFMYKDGILVEYSFSKKLLNQHKEIKKSIINKLSQFTKE